MSLDYHFHVEARLDGRWQIPSALPKRPHSKPGEFIWFSQAAVARHLFFGTRALFPLRRESPPLWTDSELHRYVGETYDLAQGAKSRWLEAERSYGATAIYTRLNITAAAREREQAEIVAAYDPPMNQGQLRATG